MNRGARRAPIFRDAADCQLFLDWVAESVSRHGIEVHLLCLMPSHFHLLIRSMRGSLSKALKHLLAGYILELNRRHTWVGSVEEVDRQVGECASGGRPPPEDFCPTVGSFGVWRPSLPPGRLERPGQMMVPG